MKNRVKTSRQYWKRFSRKNALRTKYTETSAKRDSMSASNRKYGTGVSK